MIRATEGGKMLDDETRDMLLSHARRVRENTSYGEKFLPLVVWLDASDTVVDEQRAPYGTTAAMILPHVAREAERVRAATTFIATDEYLVSGMARDEINTISMGDAFRAGDTRVTEQLGYLFIIWAERRVVGARQCYRWTPSDGWEWDDVVPTNDRVITGGSSPN